MTVVFRRRGPPGDARTALAGNCERVLASLRTHQPWRHFLTPRTWFRPLVKAVRHLRETAACLRYRTAEDLARALRTPPSTATPLRATAESAA